MNHREKQAEAARLRKAAISLLVVEAKAAATEAYNKVYSVGIIPIEAAYQKGIRQKSDIIPKENVDSYQSEVDPIINKLTAIGEPYGYSYTRVIQIVNNGDPTYWTDSDWELAAEKVKAV